MLGDDRTRSGCGERSTCRAFPRTSRPRGANPTIQLLCRSRIESVLFRGVSLSAGRNRAGSRCETAASLVPEAFGSQCGPVSHDGRQPPDHSLSALPRNCAMRNQERSSGSDTIIHGFDRTATPRRENCRNRLRYWRRDSRERGATGCGYCHKPPCSRRKAPCSGQKPPCSRPKNRCSGSRESRATAS